MLVVIAAILRPSGGSGRKRVFGVEPSYLVDRLKEAPLDEGLVDALRDVTVRAIARESARLAGGERKMILGIVRQFEGARKDDVP